MGVLRLRRIGLPGAPSVLGTDDQGREVLTWIDGDVPLPPYPAWAMTDQALADLGGLVRRFHEATATFRGTTADWSTEWADPVGGSVICHNDLYPENVVFRAGRVVALIDFAMAAPGRPLRLRAVRQRSGRGRGFLQRAVRWPPAGSMAPGLQRAPIPARPRLRDPTDERPFAADHDRRRPADLPVREATRVARHRVTSIEP